MPWDFIAILVVLAVAVPWRSALQLRRLLAAGRISSAQRRALYASTMLFQWTAAGIALWRALARGESMRALGLTGGDLPRTALISLILAALLALHQWLSIRQLAAPGAMNSPGAQLRWKLIPHSREEKKLFIALAFTAAVCEEFLYRGFVQAIFSGSSMKSIFFGMLISSAIFAAAHAYQGKKGATAAFIAGLAFSGARAWTGSIFPGMISHFLTDIMAGFLGPRSIAAQDSLASGDAFEC